MTDSKLASYPSLIGRTVLITGGGSGIGAAIVEAFARQGAKVSFLDIDATASATTCEAVKAATGASPMFLPCDLRNIPALQAAIATVCERLGPISVLVNNAASDTRHGWDTVTADYWDERMASNLRHVFFACQAVQPMMAGIGGGSIINLGSTSWRMGHGGMPAYTTAKSAILGLTRSLARDFGPANIRVNSISPGWVMTERQVKLWLDAEGEQRLERGQCLKRRLQPADIANVVLFFAADDSGICTSQDYIADGGWA